MAEGESEERLAGRVWEIKVGGEVRQRLCSDLERRKTVGMKTGQCQETACAKHLVYGILFNPCDLLVTTEETTV